MKLLKMNLTKKIFATALALVFIMIVTSMYYFINIFSLESALQSAVMSGKLTNAFLELKYVVSRDTHIAKELPDLMTKETIDPKWQEHLNLFQTYEKLSKVIQDSPEYANTRTFQDSLQQIDQLYRVVTQPRIKTIWEITLLKETGYTNFMGREAEARDLVTKILLDWEKTNTLIEQQNDELMANIEKNQQIALRKALNGKQNSILLIFAGFFISILIAWKITRSIGSTLGMIINNLYANAEQLASSAKQINASSNQIASGASEQAASLHHTSTSMEEIASRTKTNTVNARQAKELANETDLAAQNSNQNMEQLKDIMNKIKNSSNETANIIKTIDEIAFQTNLLALNAAVEAARAGDAGRGFAVVAEEVRNLAQRSAQAAKNTAELLDEAKKISMEGVDASETAVNNVKKIISMVNNVASLIQEITTAGEFQHTDIARINEEINQMSNVTQSAAAGAEESAAASNELSAQAVKLNEQVKKLAEFVNGAR